MRQETKLVPQLWWPLCVILKSVSLSAPRNQSRLFSSLLHIVNPTFAALLFGGFEMGIMMSSSGGYGDCLSCS